MTIFYRHITTIRSFLKRSYKNEVAFVGIKFQRFTSDTNKKQMIETKDEGKVEKKTAGFMNHLKGEKEKQKEIENISFLEVLKNTNVLINNTGIFTRDKSKGLIYDRILFKPKNYENLTEFISYLEKNNIKQHFDIYFYDEPLENIKLTRKQNKKEIFIDLKEVIENNKKLKWYDKKKDLVKKNINSLFHYNIQRYEANEDPSSFLIDKKRLTKEEYTYQYISTVLPYICFIFMLFFPHFLLCIFIPYIKEKNEKQKKICEIIQQKQKIHTYKEIKPDQIINFIDNNIKTIVLFYNSNIFFNTYVKSLLSDLSRILKNSAVSVNIVGIDTAKYIIQQNILKDLNENLFPLIYFILPFHYDNDSAVLKLEKPISVSNIVSQISPYVHVPKKVYHQIQALDALGNKLKRCIFEQDILNSKKGEIIYDYGSEIAHMFCMQINDEDKLF